MGARWVAGRVRAQALAGRRIGAAGARALAASTRLGDALDTLSDGPYGHAVHPGQTLAAAERAVETTLLWHLRVLAGWQPPRGAGMLRLLAAWFELSNVDNQVRALLGREAVPFHELGALSLAWRRLAATRSPAEVRTVLAASLWGDPGADTPEAIAVGTRIGWAAQVAGRVPEAAGWALGAAALLVARERWLAGRPLTGPVAARAGALLGNDALAATELSGFAARLPAPARWALSDVDDVAALWRAENHWWYRVDSDGLKLLHRPGFDAAGVVGAVAVLAVDAWRVRAALHLAARGGTPLEAFDAFA